MLETKELELSYGQERIIENLHLQIYEGKLLYLSAVMVVVNLHYCVLSVGY